jgi:hypothetical protein
VDALQKELCVGYRCVCGENVIVVRFVAGCDVVNEYPASATVSCSHGHVGTFTADQYAALELWQAGDGDMLPPDQP